MNLYDLLLDSLAANHAGQHFLSHACHAGIYPHALVQFLSWLALAFEAGSRRVFDGRNRLDVTLIGKHSQLIDFMPYKVSALFQLHKQLCLPNTTYLHGLPCNIEAMAEIVAVVSIYCVVVHEAICHLCYQLGKVTVAGLMQLDPAACYASYLQMTSVCVIPGGVPASLAFYPLTGTSSTRTCLASNEILRAHFLAGLYRVWRCLLEVVRVYSCT